MLRNSYVLLQSCAALLLTAASSSGQTSADFFDDTKLQNISITVAQKDWDALREHYLENTYYPADFTWRDITLRIGIRSRGRGSRSPIKPNIYLNFDKQVKKQRFLGLEAANLNSSNQDASLLHTLISFKLFARLGLPAPRLAMARLYINGEFFGVYNLVENIDEHFLDRNFGESSGFLYEYKPNQVFNFEWLGSDPAVYSPNLFEPSNHEDDPDPQPFVEMMSAINQSSDSAFIEAVSTYINPELYLTHAAIENVLTEIDGILGGVYGMNNFDLYRFKGSKLSQMIVWDKDLTFGQPDREILAGVEGNVLARRLLAIPKYRSIYVNALVVAATTMGDKGGWADQEVTRLYNLIHDAAIADPHKQCINTGVLFPCGPAQFEQGIQDMRSFIANRPGFVLGQVFALPQLDPAKVPVIETVRSAAPHAESGALAPGSLATIWGTGFGADLSVPAAPYPRVLDDVFVSIDGVRAPLLMISQEQVNFQVPWEISPGTASITVSYQGQLSNAASVEISPVAPAIFSVSRADGTLITRDAPPRPGESLTVWATGLGAVQVPVESGFPAENRSATTNEPTLILLNGAPCGVTFSGLAPGWVGLFHVIFDIPADFPADGNSRLELTIAGHTARIDLNSN
jgi:uncharacterized protein (TIGR03437 family)